MASTTLRQIDAQEFSRYAEKMGIHFDECLSCHTKSPSLLVHSFGNIFPALTLMNGADPLNPKPMGGGIPLVLAQCEKCGFLYLYNQETVEAKLDEQP